MQAGCEATSVSRLFRINALACLPAGPAPVQGAANSIAHIERQSADDCDECDLGPHAMSHTGCLVRVSVNKEIG